MYDWSEHAIREDASLLEALERLNRLSGTRAMVLFVTDSEGRMKGTLTDGDIRRFLIREGRMDVRAGQIMHRAFRYLDAGRADLHRVRELRRQRITLVPAIDKEGRIAAVYDFSECHSLLPADAVLMAGGRGERLRPLTLDTPKPLLKVGDKCIIDYNVEELARNGVTNIAVTVNYLADQMEQHFAGPVGGVRVRCVREPRKLGTIGSLRLVDGLENDHVIVMNSDLLTTVSFEDLFLFHLEEEADMTIAAIPYMVSVPFAIFRTDGMRITGLEEKPTYNYYANAGIYILKRSLIDRIPADCVFDATDLIERLVDEGARVVYHPIDGLWVDIGSPDDFRHAQEIVRNRQLSRL